MHKPIDDLNFWKQRIETATKEHYSVYVTGEKDWQHIFDCHKKIIGETIIEHSNVLDAGCGYGRLSVFFPEDKFTYLGVDFSPDFIERAKAKFPTRKFMVADLKGFEPSDAKFDWAVCVSIKKMVIDNLGEKEWKKIEESLKGVAHRILILEYETPDKYEII